MNKQTLIIAGLLIAGLAYDHFNGGEDSIIPSPAPPMGSELRAAFAKSDDHRRSAIHAKALGDICSTMAEVLTYDGRKSEPRIKAGVHVDDLRRTTREFALDGKSLGQEYTDLGPVVKDHFDKAVGTSGGELTAEQRAKWIAAFESLAEASYWASGEL